MQTVGMIAEFNPFHTGHAYALAQARKLAQADVVVVVMSGTMYNAGSRLFLINGFGRRRLCSMVQTLSLSCR